MSHIQLLKLGGALLGKPGALAVLADSIKSQARPTVIVHGGGPQATALSAQLGHTPTMIDGRRLTTAVDLQVHLYVTVGALNAGLVQQLCAAGLPAVGLSSATLLKCQRRPLTEIDGKQVDFGAVGDVLGVHAGLLRTLLDAGHLPVVAPLGQHPVDGLFNINADTVAVELARALGAQRLAFIAEVGAVLDGQGRALPGLDTASYRGLREAGVIVGGMRAKLDNGFRALEAGVAEVCVLSIDGLSMTALQR